MRLSNYALPIATFAFAGVASVVAATLSVSLVEDASVDAVNEQFQTAGLDWASVDATGLQVFVIGTAPNEADRFRALSNAGQVVDAARLIDQMDVVEAQQLAAPKFSIEILRNDSGVSLIGLTPEGNAHEQLVAAMQTMVGENRVSDLLETASFPAPDGWEEAIDFATDALRRLPRSKISVSADLVEVTAMADSAKEKTATESALARSKPDDLRVALSISAPRPVITPFTLRFLIDGETARFDACSADSEEARDRILRAARAAGLEGQAVCTIGLGVPSTRWAEAAEKSIAALTTLGGGSVTLSDADISLIATEGTLQGVFDTVVGELENSLPEVFDLTAVLPETPDESDEGPAEFVATLSPEGQVQLRGRVASEIARQTVESYAKAAFASAAVRMTARVDDTLPASWSVRVLAGIEALGNLSNGAVTVTKDDVRIAGGTGFKAARSEIARLLSEKLGDGAQFSIDVTYKEQLDPTAALPTPEECLERIQTVLGTRKLNFEPGSDTLDSEGKGIMDDIAEVLKSCPEIPLEIGGHTDSQGRESMNEQLSQARAEAILTELRNRRVLTASYRAVGYGETQPIADNGTEDGREENRRIEFRLIPSEPEEESQTTLESSEQSVEEDGAAQSEGSEDEQN